MYVFTITKNRKKVQKEHIFDVTMIKYYFSGNIFSQILINSFQNNTKTYQKVWRLILFAKLLGYSRHKLECLLIAYFGPDISVFFYSFIYFFRI